MFKVICLKVFSPRKNPLSSLLNMLRRLISMFGENKRLKLVVVVDISRRLANSNYDRRRSMNHFLNGRCRFGRTIDLPGRQWSGRLRFKLNLS